MIDYESRCARYGHHKLSSVRAAVREDIVRFATYSPEYRPEITLKVSISIFLKPAILCMFCYRIAHYLHVRRWRRLGQFIHRFSLLVHKANIPPQSCIGPGCFLGHCSGLTFHGTAGRNLTLLSLAVCCPQPDCFGGSAAQGPRLGDAVSVGALSVILGSVNIGDNVKIAPNVQFGADCPSDKIVFSAKFRHYSRPQGAGKSVGAED